MNREVYRDSVLVRTEEVPDELPTPEERLAALEEVLTEKQIITRDEIDERVATRRGGGVLDEVDPRMKFLDAAQGGVP